MIVNIPFTSVVYASSLAITTKHIVSLTLSVGKSVVGRSTDMYDRLALTVCSFLRDWSPRQLLSWSNPNRTVQDLLLFARVGFWKEHEILNELGLKTVSTPNSWFLETVIKYDVQYQNIICSDTYDIIMYPWLLWLCVLRMKNKQFARTMWGGGHCDACTPMKLWYSCQEVQVSFHQHAQFC